MSISHISPNVINAMERVGQVNQVGQVTQVAPVGQVGQVGQVAPVGQVALESLKCRRKNSRDPISHGLKRGSSLW